MTRRKITGIVLSGGKSLQMGYEKGLVLFEGKPMIEYSVFVLSQLCDEIIICSNNPCYNYLGFKVIPDAFNNCGPIAGLFSGLLKSRNMYNIVAPCDMPYLNKEVYTQLLQSYSRNKAVVPFFNKEIYPLCGIYSKKCIAVLNSLLQQKKYNMLQVVEELKAKIIHLNNDNFYFDENIFTNINTPEDLSKIKILI